MVLITKCRIPAETIREITTARRAGLRVIVYLSYSGLGSDVERGIRHEHTVANFPALAEAAIPIVHYWRPALPASATIEKMTAVLDLAARYAHCTMAAGLKVERAAAGRLAELWPALASTPGVTDAEGVYPAAFWEFVHHTTHRHPGYPVFHTNSCALAYVLGEPDRFGIFGSNTCRRRNHCPATQRARCAASAAHNQPSEDDIASALAGRGRWWGGFHLPTRRTRADRAHLRIEPGRRGPHPRPRCPGPPCRPSRRRLLEQRYRWRPPHGDRGRPAMIDDETLAQMLTSTRKLRRRFAAAALKPWDPVVASSELAVQLGHLALCLARRRGVDVSAVDDPDRPITDVGDELADVTLAALSVTVLAGTQPEPPTTLEPTETAPATPSGNGRDEEITALLVLLTVAGQLIEAAMVAHDYRHRPAGGPPPVAPASTATLTAVDQLADVLGLDLAEQFEAMTVDAYRFLDKHPDGHPGTGHHGEVSK